MTKSNKLDAAELAATGNGHKRKGKQAEGRGGEPSDIHLAWYYEWSSRYRSFKDIAQSAGVTTSAVHQAVHKVKDWIRAEVFDQIMDFRQRQTEALSRAASEAYEAWERSKQVATVKVTETGSNDKGGWDKESFKEEPQVGNPAFLAEFRAAQDDIRKIWGVDMPKKLQISTEFDGLIDPMGLDHDEAILRQAEAIIEARNGTENQSV